MTRTALLGALALCLASCGYRAGFTLPERKNIGVAIFDNAQIEHRYSPIVAKLVFKP